MKSKTYKVTLVGIMQYKRSKRPLTTPQGPLEGSLERTPTSVGRLPNKIGAWGMLYEDDTQATD